MYRPYNKLKYNRYGLVEEIALKETSQTDLISLVQDKFREMPLSKKAQNISSEELTRLNYPRRKEIHAEHQYNVVEGEAYSLFYFDAEKFLRRIKLNRLADNERVLIFLDKFMYENDLLNKFATADATRTIKYNNLSAREQYSVDDRNSMIKKGVLGVITTFVVGVLFLNIIPNIRLNQAQNYIVNGQYEKAHKFYKNRDPKYAYLTNAFINLDEGNLEEAIQSMEEIKVNPAEFTLIDFKEVSADFYAKLAEIYKEDNKLLEASLAYEETLHSNTYKTNFMDTTYEAVKELYKQEEYYNSFVQLMKILGYKDTEEILSSMTKTLYDEGMVLYQNKQYNQAKDRFIPLAQINYENSATMMKQGDYILGLESYLKQDFETAENMLRSISPFKDSELILRDITYQKGLTELKKGYTEAYPYILASINFKDANRMLRDPSMVLYGEWAIVEKGYTVITNSSLRFDLDNNLVITSDDKIDIAEGVYKYDKDSKAYLKDDAKLFIEVKDRNNIVITSDYNGFKNEYRLEKKLDLETKSQDGFSQLIKDRINLLLDGKEVEKDE